MPLPSRTERDIIWRPQLGPQTSLVQCVLPEIFFGGARGAGKTDGVLGKWALKDAQYGAAFNAIMFRRTSVSAVDAIERSKQIYGPLGGRFNEAKLRWRMPAGGRVAFAYLDTVEDANEYQGRNVTDAWVEEAGQYARPDAIDRLFGVLRSAAGVPVQLILTGNPGGAGQHWIRERYKLAPFPRCSKMLTRRLANGTTHTYAVIPGRIGNNKLLLDADPDYVNRLQLVGSPQLVKAWLEGDWTAVEGAFFAEWSEVLHVLPPLELPRDWLRLRSGDWGSASPFSFGGWAVAGDEIAVPGADGRGTTVIPRGALIRYREWYGAAPNKQGLGLKLTAEQVADGLIARERGDPKLTYGVLDPSAFRQDGGPSIAERINLRLILNGLPPFRGADNARVARVSGEPAKAGPMGGWDCLRARLVGLDGRPMIYCFATCRDSIRTIPVLQHDPQRAEDLDTDAEDHAADDWRYACMSRPWVPAARAPAPATDAYVDAMDEEEREAQAGNLKTL